MKRCVYCKIRYRKGIKTSFHRFPINLTQRRQWLNNMNAPMLHPKESEYLCSKHFDNNCFIKHHSRTTLKSDSVPTIFEDPNSFEAPEIGDCVNVSGGKEMDVDIVEDTKPKIYPYKYDPNSFEALEIGDCVNVSGGKEMDVDIVEETKPKIYPYKYAMSTTPTSASSSLSKCQSPNKGGVKRLLSESILEDNKGRKFQKDASTTTDELERDRLLQDSIRNDHNYGASRSPKKSKLENSIAHDHSYENSPRSSEKALQSTKRLLKLSNARVTFLTRCVKRLKIEVDSLKTVTNDLEKRNKISKDCMQLLKQYDTFQMEFFNRILNNTRAKSLNHDKYPPQLRDFAITLYFYSPKAYTYVRKKFNLALPHPRVIRSW